MPVEFRGVIFARLLILNSGAGSRLRFCLIAVWLIRARRAWQEWYPIW